MDSKSNSLPAQQLYPSFSNPIESSFHHSITGRLQFKSPLTSSTSSIPKDVNLGQSTNDSDTSSVSASSQISSQVIPHIPIPNGSGLLTNFFGFPEFSPNEIIKPLNDIEQSTRDRSTKNRSEDENDFLGLQSLSKNVVKNFRNLFESNSRFVRQMFSLMSNPNPNKTNAN